MARQARSLFQSLAPAPIHESPARIASAKDEVMALSAVNSPTLNATPASMPDLDTTEASYNPDTMRLLLTEEEDEGETPAFILRAAGRGGRRVYAEFSDNASPLSIR